MDSSTPSRPSDASAPLIGPSQRPSDSPAAARASRSVAWYTAGAAVVVVGLALTVYFLASSPHGSGDDSGGGGNGPNPPMPAVFAAPAAPLGGTVAFISPAFPIYFTSWTNATYPPHVASIGAAIGMTPVFSPNAFAQFGYLAGTDEQRVSDIHAMFSNTSVRAIVANRGGWGCNRIIDMLNYDLIRANPKPIMGYSDLTGLLNAIHFRTGMVTFHGPMGLDNWDSISVGYFQQVLQQGRQVNFSNPPSFNLSAVTTITSGTTTGRLVGGNLSVFTAMLGSKFLPPPEAFRNFILFLEEVGEETYRLDRMLEQLALSGILQAVRGFVFGVCTDCSTALSCDGPVPPASQTFSVAQVLQQKVQPLGVPAFAGAMFGHELPQQFILPIGGLVSIDADAGTITMLESAVALPRAPRV